VTLLAFVAERRPAVRRGAVDRYLLPAAGTQQQTRRTLLLLSI